jgi:hypothetical protein
LATLEWIRYQIFTLSTIKSSWQHTRLYPVDTEQVITLLIADKAAPVLVATVNDEVLYVKIQ